MKNIFKDRSKLFKLIIFIVSLLLLVGLVWFLLLGNGFSFLGNNTTTGGKLGDKIYFSDSNKLMSVNVKTKEAKVIDEGISSKLQVYRLGSQYPLNSKNFQKVAYVKDNSVWIYDGNKSQKINQPNIESKKASSILISAWSPKADYLVYFISDGLYNTNPELSNKPDQVADDSTVGFYVYSVSKSKSTKLSDAKSVMFGWVPGTNKIAYLKENPENADNSEGNLKNIYYYDVTNNASTAQLDESLTGGLLRFSDDGSKVLYSNVLYENPIQNRYMISNPDLTDAKVATSFNNAEITDVSPDFLKGSFKYIAYTNLESTSCDKPRVPTLIQGENKGCFAKYLKTNKNDKKSQELIDWYGFYDFDKAVVLNGLDNSSVEKTEKTLALYNVESGETEKLYSSQYPVYAKPLLAIGDSLKIQVSGL